MGPLPAPVAALAGRLAGVPGVRAVTLGGSRATGAADAGSDWDLGLHYRGALDLAALGLPGEVHPPGAWGRIMNGGAWLCADGLKIDVLFRDLDAVERWRDRALAGEFEVDALLGYLAGCPTYSLCAERALSAVVAGALPPPDPFPERLAEAAPPRWRFHARFSLEHARMRAGRGDVAGTAGQAAKAAVEAAHARLCERRTWHLNEKRILEAAGLAAAVQPLFSRLPGPAGLGAWVGELEAALGLVPDREGPRP